MSLLNVLIHPDRALVAVDTRMMEVETGRYFEGSKMFPMIHSNVLFACRGDRVFPLFVFDWFLGCMGEAFRTYDLDAVERDIPVVLAKVKERYTEKSDLHGAAESHLGIDLVVVGWSEKHQTMRGLSCVSERGGEFSIGAMETGRLGPIPTEDLRHVHCNDEVEYLTTVARSQVRQVRRDDPGFPIGGRLLLAELTRDTLSVRTVADLEQSPTHA